MGSGQSSDLREIHSYKCLHIQRETSQIDHLTLHPLELEKGEQIKAKAGRRKKMIK